MNPWFTVLIVGTVVFALTGIYLIYRGRRQEPPLPAQAEVPPTPVTASVSAHVEPMPKVRLVKNKPARKVPVKKMSVDAITGEVTLARVAKIEEKIKPS